MKKVLKCLIVKYGDMRLGGIQTIIYNYTKLYLQNEGKVIWIAPKKYDIDAGFRDFMNNDRVYITDSDGAINEIEKEMLDYDLDVCAISFNFGGFLDLSFLEKRLNITKFNNLFIVPNVLGNGVKVEGNKNEYRHLKNVYQKLLVNRNILFCNRTQFTAFVNHYGIKIDKAEELLLPSAKKIEELNKEKIIKRFASKEIITVSRFDFPHKGYILGLIDNFSVLKKNYPNVTLRIIGYGNGLNSLKTKISSMEPDIADSIILEGPVPYNKLYEYYNNAKVFIGLAGALLDAVSYGLLSIIARHYCDSCEVYGFYHSSPDKVISSEPGDPIINFLDIVFSLELKQYVEMSLEGYEMYKKEVELKQKRSLSDISIVKRQILTDSELNENKTLYNRYMRIMRRRRNITYLKSPIQNAKRLFSRYFKN